MKKLMLLFVFALYLAPQAHSSTIYDSGFPNSSYSLMSDNNPWVAADSFVLQSDLNTVSDVHWWGVYHGSTYPVKDDFVITIYEDSSGTPGASVSTYNAGSVTRESTGLEDLFYMDIYYYSTFIEPLVLNPGEKYWLSIFNSYSWAWSFANPLDNSLQYNGSDWIPFNDGLAFNLTNDAAPIPEPSTFLLLSGGLAGLAFVARRRKKE